MLKPDRARHSRSVAALTAELCARYGVDPARGEAAGLAHDLCKELPRAVQRELAAAYPDAARGSSLMSDKILHGPAAAVYLERELGVSDLELLDAVASHTVGKPGMGLLATLLYCADKLDPGREGIDPEHRNRCLSLPPPLMLGAVVAELISWLEATGRAVAPETVLLYNNLAKSTVL
ncbi:MAG: bis(5'-nucleosyl)-tetraphosphatase (symmetrical) YqeK [Spirochaetaceae bacterium]|nr:bis(5'-nucleosyl)-tetraphosphatase (symmetrical) YqeK [Spirochaetaceae bacterium]